MKIVTTRRICQVFFFALFIWFCIVSTVGENFQQIRNWPVNWFLQLDPLVAIGTILTTHTLYAPLLWALATVILTIILGRFFCSWVCPFGSIHHFTGFLANRKKTTAQKIALNKYRKAHCIKYIILIVFLAMAAFPSIAATLQTGLLDPIPLLTRSVNLVLLPIIDKPVNITSVDGRFYEGAWLIFTIVLTAILLNLIIPRFYCRFICPLGALFGILGRFAFWRIGKNQNQCSDCKLCEKNCEGGCEPAGNIKIAECLLCLNCRQDCKDELMSYQTQKSLPEASSIPGASSIAGEKTNPDISRRGFMLSIAGGVLAVPAVRLSNQLGGNWNEKIVRPPGSIGEEEFLKRCIKCSQCMRICPTNVIQPAGINTGLETLWTPVLNNRIGSSGCQLNCVACGQLCPTSAIRAISLDEKLGKGKFADSGPIKIGTAFFDQNRCLPWAMDKPCIVCEENCPLSPKAIYTREIFSTIRDGILTVKKVKGDKIEFIETIEPDKFATGDYYCLFDIEITLPITLPHRIKIIENTKNTIKISKSFKNVPPVNSTIEMQVRLQRPYVDIEKCNGCGICEHQCPVSGKKAVRISAEGETRNPDRPLLPGS